ncbi:F0F1 ATP synthase subunit alpha, partial [Candidatus Uhrbacteria bacterium]|nr:F0F1 ATP synthase subunit alpha [Candidatus Uhrbacteria bacterium]
MSLAHQVASLFAVTRGHCDEVEIDKITEWEHGMHEYLDTEAEGLLIEMEEVGELTDEIAEKLETTLKNWNTVFADK